MQVQVRSESTGIQFFNSFREALIYARGDTSVWKLSFSLQTGERIRLVKESGKWVYEPVM